MPYFDTILISRPPLYRPGVPVLASDSVSVASDTPPMPTAPPMPFTDRVLSYVKATTEPATVSTIAEHMLGQPSVALVRRALDRLHHDGEVVCALNSSGFLVWRAKPAVETPAAAPPAPKLLRLPAPGTSQRGVVDFLADNAPCRSSDVAEALNFGNASAASAPLSHLKSQGIVYVYDTIDQRGQQAYLWALTPAAIALLPARQKPAPDTRPLRERVLAAVKTGNGRATRRDIVARTGVNSVDSTINGLIAEGLIVVVGTVSLQDRGRERMREVSLYGIAEPMPAHVGAVSANPIKLPPMSLNDLVQKIPIEADPLPPAITDAPGYTFPDVDATPPVDAYERSGLIMLIRANPLISIIVLTWLAFIAAYFVAVSK